MTTQWTVNSGGTSPILSNGVLYYLTGNGVRALNPTTGAVLWSDSSGGVGLHWQSPIVAGGSLYYADGGGHLRAFHLPGGITRISGNDRYDVSAAVSSSLAAGVPVAYVASGANYPDALSGSAVAGRDGGPMLLVQPDAIPASIATELNRLHPGKIIVLGGTASVSDAVFSALHGYTTGTVSRIAGADRYVVSAAISDSYAPGIGVAYVTTGENFPDALSATPLAADNESAISAAWLNPLPHNRQRCSGTGTSRPASAGKCRAINRAAVVAKASRPPYLSRSATVFATGP